MEMRVFINGRLLTGAQSLEAFRRVIDEELASASHDRCPCVPSGLWTAVRAC